MRLGHVDEFGQYISEIDQAPPGKLKGIYTICMYMYVPAQALHYTVLLV